MKLKYSLLFLLFICMSVFAAAAPEAMLQSTTEQVISQLRANEATLKTNPKVVYGIINSIIVPHFDTEGMARSVLPRNVWTSATSEQRAQFTRQFTKLLVRTYSSALASYQNEEVKYLPMRSTANGQRVQINSQIIRQSGPAIAVSYRLIQIGNQWKIYDFNVEGISMLQSYRSQFTSQLSSGGDINTLIQKLSQHDA